MIKISVIAIGILILGLGAYMLFRNPSPSSPMMQKVTEQKNAVMEKIDDRYLAYSKATYDAAVEKRRVLFFYATWCPTCKQANQDFTANSNKIPENVTVLRVNYNDSETDQEEKELAKKYSITYQHTFVQIDEQGKEITKWNGGQVIELVSNIK